MSFETAKQLVKLIREVKKMKTPGGITCVGLVGNKMDLKHERTVSRKEGTDFATEYECFLMETSALNNINVEQVFHDVVRQMRKSRSWKKKDKKTKNFFSRWIFSLKTRDFARLLFYVYIYTKNQLKYTGTQWKMEV